MLSKVLIFNTLFIFYCCPVEGKCRADITKNVTSRLLLRQDLLCSYDKESYPVIDFQNNVTVNLWLTIKLLTLDEHRNILDVHGFLGMTWKDEGLKWNLADYPDVDLLLIKSYDIWQPDISVYSTLENMEKIKAWDYAQCVIDHVGFVFCVPIIKWKAQCITNVQHWPFDQQHCNLVIGSWSGKQMDLQIDGGGINLSSSSRYREWELLNSSATKKVLRYESSSKAAFQSIHFSFHIKRHADAYAATVIIPSLSLSMLTLASYWLDSKKTNRLALCYFSTLCHCLYLQYLGIKLPVNGNLTPRIILLYRDSLIITGMALLLAVINQRLSSSSDDTSSTSIPIPAWLGRFIGVVSYQKAGQILLLGKFDSERGDATSLMENVPQPMEGKESHEWVMPITIIDRLGFLISLIAYIILYIALIPSY